MKKEMVNIGMTPSLMVSLYSGVSEFCGYLAVVPFFCRYKGTGVYRNKLCPMFQLLEVVNFHAEHYELSLSWSKASVAAAYALKVDWCLAWVSA